MKKSGENCQTQKLSETVNMVRKLFSDNTCCFLNPLK
jgi:hypothetical protein